MTNTAEEKISHDIILILMGLILLAFSMKAFFPWQILACMIAQMGYLGYWVFSYLQSSCEQYQNKTASSGYALGFALWALVFFLAKVNII